MTEDNKEQPQTAKNGKHYVIIVGKKTWQDYLAEGLRAMSQQGKEIEYRARGPNGAMKVASIGCFLTSNDMAPALSITIEGVSRTYDGQATTVPEISMIQPRRSKD